MATAISILFLWQETTLALQQRGEEKVPGSSGGYALVLPEESQMLGEEGAPVTIVAFTDLFCPFCRQFQRETFDLLKTQLLDTGQAKFIAVDFVSNSNPAAEAVAEAVFCASDSRRFWQLHSMVLMSPGSLSFDDILSRAHVVESVDPAFNSCVASRKYRKKLIENLRLAREVRVISTPMFIVGKSTSLGLAEMVRVSGFRSYEDIKLLVDGVAKGVLPKTGLDRARDERR